MSWNRFVKPSYVFAAHTLLFCFTILLVLKLDHLVSYSWWTIFFPLFLFHAVVARARFSFPGSYVSNSRHVPLLVVFEMLLCVFLESSYVKKAPTISLKIVFLPLLAFELTILVHNLRMGKALLSAAHRILIDDATWETLCYFCIVISMCFLGAGTVLTLRKLSDDSYSLSWWKLFICFGIAECFAFPVCTKWSNIYRNSQNPLASSSSMTIRYLNSNGGVLVSTEDISENRMCDLGGHVMKIAIIVFQILVCMRLELQVKSAASRFIPLPVVFSPIFLAQGLGVYFAASDLMKKIAILLPTWAGTGTYYTYAARARHSFGFLSRGSRLFVWWSTDEGSREEQARMQSNESSGYNTFSGNPPETKRGLPRNDQTDKARRLRAALKEQKEITKASRQNSETNSCKICFDRDISTVLLPCGHRFLCRICSDKCEKCPFCRAIVEKRLPV
ncbi:hypothetical protein R6Q59_034255 [Mikania micrantha]